MFSPRVMASYVLVGLLIAAVSAGIALLVIDGKPGGPGVEVFMPHPHDPSRAEGERERSGIPSGRLRHEGG